MTTSETPAPTATAPIPVTHDRRKVDRAINDLEARMVTRAKVVDELKITLDTTQADVLGIKNQLDKNSADTKEVLDILHAGKGFFKVVGWCGGVIKWCLLLAAPAVTFYYALKGGGHK